MHTREIAAYGGLVHRMPRYAVIFMIFTMANVGLPGTAGFVGEFLTLLGAFRASPWVAFFATTGVILSAGYRIGPFEVESALIEHPAVAESAVVSSPDEKRGEVVKAFVVLAPGHVASEALAKSLQEHVKAVTAPYKYPRRIEFVEQLPKTVSGKIRRVELREREWKDTP
jgi:NADH:ubiquinone oxidoreductase subunit 4 (subunit M)